MRLGDIVAWTTVRHGTVLGLVVYMPDLAGEEHAEDLNIDPDPDKHIGIIPNKGKPILRYPFTVTAIGERDRNGDVLVTQAEADAARPGLERISATYPNIETTFRAKTTESTDPRGNITRHVWEVEPSGGRGIPNAWEEPMQPYEGYTSWPTKQMWRYLASGGYIPHLERILNLLGPRQRQVFVRCCIDGIPHRQLIREIQAAEGIRLSESHISTTRKLAEDRVMELTGLKPQEDGAA